MKNKQSKQNKIGKFKKKYIKIETVFISNLQIRLLNLLLLYLIINFIKIYVNISCFNISNKNNIQKEEIKINLKLLAFDVICFFF